MQEAVGKVPGNNCNSTMDVKMPRTASARTL